MRLPFAALLALCLCESSAAKIKSFRLEEETGGTRAVFHIFFSFFSVSHIRFPSFFESPLGRRRLLFLSLTPHARPSPGSFTNKQLFVAPMLAS